MFLFCFFFHSLLRASLPVSSDKQPRCLLCPYLCCLALTAIQLALLGIGTGCVSGRSEPKIWEVSWKNDRSAGSISHMSSVLCGIQRLGPSGREQAVLYPGTTRRSAVLLFLSLFPILSCLQIRFSQGSLRHILIHRKEPLV